LQLAVEQILFARNYTIRLLDQTPATEWFRQPPDGVASPQPGELVIPLVVWSWTFEILLPAIPSLGNAFVADHLDVLAYCAGALGAGSAFTDWTHVNTATGPTWQSLGGYATAISAEAIQPGQLFHGVFAEGPNNYAYIYNNGWGSLFGPQMNQSNPLLNY
jgi:hypothetical protein